MRLWLSWTRFFFFFSLCICILIFVFILIFFISYSYFNPLLQVKASGAGAGQVWWMQREMYEKQKYLPKAKQTMAYPKPE